MNIYKFKHFYINKYVASRFTKKRYALSYDYKHKAVWFRVAKVASRTINEHFKESSGNKYVYSSEVGYFHSFFSNYFKFAFVRHPVGRVYSAWKNKVRDTNYFGFNEVTLREMQNISNFIKWLEQVDINNCDEHIKLQCEMIDLNHIDYIGRFERFNKDFSEIASIVGLNLGQIRWENRTIRHSEILTEEDIQNIKRIYRKDIQIFYPNSL